MAQMQEIRRLLGKSRCDMADNEWQETFRVSRDLVADKRTFHAAIGGSFYDRLLPNETVCFVFSFAAIHWVRAPSPPIMQATMEDLLHLEKLQEEEARSSLSTLLLLSFDVLKPGGVAFFSFIGFPDNLNERMSSCLLSVLIPETLSQLMPDLSREDLEAICR